MREPIRVPWTGEPSQEEKMEFFESLHLSMMRPCLAASYNLVRDWHAAEECVQDAFLILWDKLEAMEPGADAVRWLFAAVRHRGLKLLTKRVRETPFDPRHVGQYVETLSGGATPAHTFELHEHATALLRGLPERERTAFVLKEANTLSSKEISKIMGVGEPAVRQYIYRARCRFRDTVQEKTRNF